MTTRAPIKTAIIVGSIRGERFAGTILDWVENRVSQDPRFAHEIVDPQALSVTAWHGDMADEDLAALRSALGEADAFIVVTPEYNHSFPASVKSLIDAGKAEWQHKPVAFVSYGGISGGLRAVEQLRLVFAELRAHTVRDTASLAMAASKFDDDGQLIAPDGPDAAMTAVLDDLHWWAAALLAARDAANAAEAA